MLLAIFNFTLITRHNIMKCNLESHPIAIKGFGMQHTCSIFFNEGLHLKGILNLEN